MAAGSFTTDITATRERARQKMADGPVTGSYGKDSVITTYQEVIRWLGDGDPTTRRLLAGSLADEEEHADDLVDLLVA